MDLGSQVVKTQELHGNSGDFLRLRGVFVEGGHVQDGVAPQGPRDYAPCLAGLTTSTSSRICSSWTRFRKYVCNSCLR